MFFLNFLFVKRSYIYTDVTLWLPWWWVQHLTGIYHRRTTRVRSIRVTWDGSCQFIFMLVAVALLVRRYYVSDQTTIENRNKLIVFLLLIIGSSIATATYWGASKNGWIAYCITIPIWLLATFGLCLFVPHARDPKLWGVPLVPWLPSASIAINIFLLGSIDKDSFIRFSVWTAFLLVYYLLFGLHASYDTAKEFERKETEEGNVPSVTKSGIDIAEDGRIDPVSSTV